MYPSIHDSDCGCGGPRGPRPAPCVPCPPPSPCSRPRASERMPVTPSGLPGWPVRLDVVDRSAVHYDRRDDVGDAERAIARANLSVYSRAEVDVLLAGKVDAIPSGSVYDLSTYDGVVNALAEVITHLGGTPRE